MTRISQLTGRPVIERSLPANGEVELKRGRLMFDLVAGRGGTGHRNLTLKLKELEGKRHE
ncbi:hypothetical protein MMAN_36330 [Mycobacterium mantenii]|uniref:Uncharacterized protein n=1 Tax=Mycobacterium mantenii TaxID=560555 RepID=A0ABM7JV96_MYCNT|nr:hypothetical protein MMAN_36330 [Mycobacterium mantenii]